jgi:hypothetical protein
MHSRRESRSPDCRLHAYIELGLGTITMEPGMRIAAPGQDPIPVEPAWTEVSGEGHVVQDTLPGGPAACDGAHGALR